jgi:ankyrin repeat protein
VIQLLLKHGASANVIRRKLGDTPLHWAAGSGRVDVVRALLNGGADRHIANSAGFVPLDLAHEYHKEEV